MSGYESYPPPGAPAGGPATPPPPQWAPGWGPPPPPSSAPRSAPPSWNPQPGMLGAAHKPGAVPLRPLGLGDIYDAAFRTIRFNPKATVGAAVLVAAVTMAVPVLVTALLTLTVGLTLDETDSALGSEVGSWSTLTSVVLLQVSLVFVTAFVAHVVSEAAVGRRTTLGEAWEATRGRRWRLVGLAVLVLVVVVVATVGYVLAWVLVVVVTDSVLAAVLFGVVSVPAFVALMLWVWIRLLYLPAPALMLESVGVFGAIRRSYRLTSGAFWRTLGIALLTLMVTGIAGQMLAFPFGIIGAVLALVVDAQYGPLVLVLTQALSTVVSAAFVAPFTSAVASLQYVDQRMRKEAYDVELMTRAGIIGS